MAGFDLIYSCQDADFDAERGLHSIPARVGVARALWISRALHLGTAASLALFCIRIAAGPLFAVAAVLACVLLAWEQSLVRANDLSRVNVAFFTINGWVGVALFAGLAADMAIIGG